MRKQDREQGSPSARGGRLVHTPAGRCPVPLTGTDTAAVRTWAAAVVRAGHAAGAAYGRDALRYWVRHFSPPGSPDYQRTCGHLDALFGPAGEPRPELLSPPIDAAAGFVPDTGAAVSAPIATAQEATGDAVTGSADPGLPSSAAHPAVALADLPLHPACARLPAMTDEEYQLLKYDIRAHGLREPVCIYQEQILDGRHRYRACRELGIEPHLVEWDGPGSPIALVLSLNLHRRHLSTSQRAMLAGKVRALFQAEAQQRMRSGKAAADPPLTSEGGAGGEAAAQAARLLGVGKDSVYKAAQVQATGVPELQQAVENGTVTVSTAAVLAERPVEEQQKVLRQGGDAVRQAAREGRQGKAARTVPDDGRAAGWPKRVDQLAAELLERYSPKQLRELVRRLTAQLATADGERAGSAPSYSTPRGRQHAG